MEERLEALKEEKERLLNSVVEAEYVLKCNRVPFLFVHNFHFSSKIFVHVYSVRTIEFVTVSFVAEELLSCGWIWN